MKKVLSIIVLFTATICVAMAQPALVKKAAKSVFKITSFDANGDMLHSGYGAFVGENGEALTTWNVFVGASSAKVIDAQGRKYDVDCLVGANEIYNVSKIRVIVPNDKKMAISPLTIATTQINAGGESWLVEYDVKNPTAKKYSPTKVESFQNNLPYYIFEETAREELAGSPFLNANGELLGLMEPARKRTDLYCASAQYAMSMTPTGFTAKEATMRQTNIRIALPTDKNQALLAMMMAKSNPTTLLATTEEFISLFPTLYDGYETKAEYYISQENYAEADKTMKECMEKAEAKDEAHYTFSRLILNKLTYSTDSTFTTWTIDTAIDEIDAAININPSPVYSMHKAKLLYAQKKYKEAHDLFIEVSKTQLKSGECFYDAALCLEALNAPSSQIKELLDSAVACYPQPYTVEAAPYLYIRGQHLANEGQYRMAVNDYNEYERLMAGRLAAPFYYQKEQIEVKSKLYQQAINDISHAVVLDTTNELYLAELALLCVKVNKIDDGIKAAQLCMERFPEYGDGYAIYGLALITQGKKKEGISFLEKALTLGSDMAQPLLEKYK